MIKIYFKRKNIRGPGKDSKDRIASAFNKIIPELIKSQKALTAISKDIKLDIQLTLK